MRSFVPLTTLFCVSALGLETQRSQINKNLPMPKSVEVHRKTVPFIDVVNATCDP